MNPEQNQSEFDSLKESVQDLKRQIAQDNSGLKRWAGILALVAALFAVPHGVIDLYNGINTLYARPKTSLTAGGPLKMLYDPQEQTIEFDFDLAIANAGTRSDIIKGAKASLQSAPSPSTDTTIPFADNDIYFFENGAPRAIPFDIEKDRSRLVKCVIKANIGEHDVALLQQSGERKLVVDLIGENNRMYSVSYCPTLTTSICDEVFKSATPIVKRFLNPYCPNK